MNLKAEKTPGYVSALLEISANPAVSLIKDNPEGESRSASGHQSCGGSPTREDRGSSLEVHLGGASTEGGGGGLRFHYIRPR